jgi:hypothetical protein
MPGLGLGLRGLAAGAIAPWQFANAVIDLDFANNRYFGGTLALLSLTQAGPTYAENLDGSLTAFAPSTLRRTNKGILVEEGRTNVVLWASDLTNAAWTKTNCTAAQNQVGPDGSTVSSLAATAANGTCLQAITLVSSARFQSAYVKRITGAGAIQMTMDNGATWTAIVPTSAWTKLTIPTQTLANPTVGFRIVTSGDAIAVAFVQNENGIFATSPILTTVAAATRDVDVLQITGAALAILQGANFTAQIAAGAVPNGGSTKYVLGEAAGNRMLYVTLAGVINTYNGTTILTATAGLGSWNTDGNRVALARTAGGRTSAMNGGAAATDAGVQPVPVTVQLGTAVVPVSAYIQRLTLWNSALTGAELTRNTGA